MQVACESSDGTSRLSDRRQRPLLATSDSQLHRRQKDMQTLQNMKQNTWKYRKHIQEQNHTIIMQNGCLDRKIRRLKVRPEDYRRQPDNPNGNLWHPFWPYKRLWKNQTSIRRARWHIIEHKHAIKTGKQGSDRLLHLRSFLPEANASAGLREDCRATGRRCEAPRGLRKEEGGPRKGEEVLLTCAGARFGLPTRDIGGEDDRGCGDAGGGNRG